MKMPEIKVDPQTRIKNLVYALLTLLLLAVYIWTSGTDAFPWGLGFALLLASSVLIYEVTISLKRSAIKNVFGDIYRDRNPVKYWSHITIMFFSVLGIIGYGLEILSDYFMLPD